MLEIGDDRAFQTWGTSSRFAIVPMRGDEDEDDTAYAWFAAMTEEARTPGDMPGDARGVLANGSRGVRPEEWRALRRRLQQHHQPVRQVLDATSWQQVQVANAMASSSLALERDAAYAHLPVLFLGDARHTVHQLPLQTCTQTRLL
jgi:2-polyprenyl-6-methoxyphenol hydroxylase-like FAD-dependent oxidoreductase